MKHDVKLTVVDVASNQKLDYITTLLHSLLRQGDIMAVEIDRLKAAVAKNRDQTDSVLVLLKGLKKALDDAVASGDMAQVADIAAQIEANNQALADATAENTPNA